MLNFITKKQEYQYFDTNNQIQTKQLNVFQKFLRNIFGCYAETHLSNVAKKAFEVDSINPFNSLNTQNKTLLKIISKAAETYGHKNPCSIYDLSDNNKDKIHMSYDIKKIGDNLELSAINYNFNFDGKKSQRNIVASKNENGEIIVKLPSNYTNESAKKESIIKEKKTINDFVCRLLKQSSICSELTVIEKDIDGFTVKLRGNEFLSQK